MAVVPVALPVPVARLFAVSEMLFILTFPWIFKLGLV